jgi:hypothetical protein
MHDRRYAAAAIIAVRYTMRTAAPTGRPAPASTVRSRARALERAPNFVFGRSRQGQRSSGRPRRRSSLRAAVFGHTRGRGSPTPRGRSAAPGLRALDGATLRAEVYARRSLRSVRRREDRRRGTGIVSLAPCDTRAGTPRRPCESELWRVALHLSKLDATPIEVRPRGEHYLQSAALIVRKTFEEGQRECVVNGPFGRNREGLYQSAVPSVLGERDAATARRVLSAWHRLAGTVERPRRSQPAADRGRTIVQVA